MHGERVVTPGRVRRLREELLDEAAGVVEAASHPEVVLDELDYALRPARHERRRPTYGSIVVPRTPIEHWADETGLRVESMTTNDRRDQELRRYADGLGSWTIRHPDGIGALVVFDRSAGSERDLVVLAAATGAIIVQRRPDSGVRAVGSFGVARWDGSSWYVEPPFETWLRRASCGLPDDETDVLDRVLRFAVHDLGAAGIGATFVVGGAAADGSGSSPGLELRLEPPPPLRIGRPTDLGPLRHVLAQVDGAAILDAGGTLRHLGVRLVPSTRAEADVDAWRGTRHTSARRYSADDTSAIVVTVSEDGPVTVFRGGDVVGRSIDDA